MADMEIGASTTSTRTDNTNKILYPGRPKYRGRRGGGNGTGSGAIPGLRGRGKGNLMTLTCMNKQKPS